MIRIIAFIVVLLTIFTIIGYKLQHSVKTHVDATNYQINELIGDESK